MPVFCSTCRIAFRVERSAVCSWCRSHETRGLDRGSVYSMLWCTEWITMSERCTDETGPFRCGRVQTFTRQLREAKTIQVARFRVLAECTRVLTSLPNQRGDSTGATYTVRRLLRCLQLLHCGGPAGPAHRACQCGAAAAAAAVSTHTSQTSAMMRPRAARPTRYT